MKCIEQVNPDTNGIRHVFRLSDDEAFALVEHGGNGPLKTKGPWKYIPKHIWKAGRGAY